MERQELVTETFNRLLERGAVAKSDVDAALAAAGHPPATAEEWCRAAGEPTPRERRHGEGLTDRQYALLGALFDLAPHGGLGMPEAGLDVAALNALLARRDQAPTSHAEVTAALERSLAALHARATRERQQAAIMGAIHDLAAELGVGEGEPVFAALDRAGFHTERLLAGTWQPTGAERALLERVARECVAAEPDCANAARALLRRSREDVALREAVLSLALETAAGDNLADDGEAAERNTLEVGRLRASAVLELCRRLAPEEPPKLALARVRRTLEREIQRHGRGRGALDAVMTRIAAEPATREALAREELVRMAELEIAQSGLEPF